MKKKSKNDVWNLIFSAFLVTAYMICSNFFIGMINDSFAQDAVKKTLLTALVFVLFGLILFYATRVGDGKQVMRFSAATLIIMVLPALYVILASVMPSMPFYDKLSSHIEVVYIAAAALGYGLPYTFFSGYELDKKKENTEQTVEPDNNTLPDEEKTDTSDTAAYSAEAFDTDEVTDEYISEETEQ